MKEANNNLYNYSEFVKEGKSDFNFKEIFLALTDYTVPFGYEEELEPLLYQIVPNLQKDGYGNYHITIGQSRTLFTSHLDTYCKRREKVNHVIKGRVIKTDGTTVLGGDNKNGVLVLLYMVLNNVPGTYYFFKGEEGIVTGESCNGSTWLLKNNPDVFGKFDRAIAFDRRGKGSIVTKQRARHCCSDDFANAIVDDFGELGLKFKKDYAYGTDSAVFMDIVPEITNISSGGEYEHSFMESTDINYTKKIAIAATQIDWEALPTVRKPEAVLSNLSDENFDEETIERSKKTFKKVKTVLYVKGGFQCINEKDFSPNTVMMFDQYTTDTELTLTILNDDIAIIDDNEFLDGFERGSVEELIEHLKLKNEDFAKKMIGGITRKMNTDYEVTKEELDKILDEFFISYDVFKEWAENSEDYSKYFKFYGDKIFMDIIAGQGVTIKRQKEQEKRGK